MKNQSNHGCQYDLYYNVIKDAIQTCSWSKRDTLSSVIINCFTFTLTINTCFTIQVSLKKTEKIYICIIKMRNSHFCQCQFYNSFNLHNQFLWHSTRTSNLSLLSHEVFSTFPYTFLKFGSYVAHNINTVKSYLHVYID